MRPEFDHVAFEELWKVSGGYPLLLRSFTIAYDLSASPQPSDQLFGQRFSGPFADRVSGTRTRLAPPPDETLPLVIQHVVKSLCPNEQTVARIASLIGMEIDEDHLAALSGFAIAVVRKAIRGLIDLGIVDSNQPLRFRHRLTAEAITSSLDETVLGELRYLIATADVLPLNQRAMHALLAGSFLPLASALALSGKARNVARQDHIPNHLVELSDLERTTRLQHGELDPLNDFALCTDLAFASEALGKTSQGNHYRELALQIAERQGNFEWAALAVLTPPANGRAIADGRSSSQVSRAINLAGPESSKETMLQLRTERVHRLGISGATIRIPNEDLVALRLIVQSEVSPDAWIQIIRARVCSDLALATPAERLAAATSLASVRTQCDDIDLRSDSLVLIVRNALEMHDIEHVDAALQQVEAELLHSKRPVDRWTRNVLRCTALAIRGQLTAAYSHAVEAQRLGVVYGISDSALTWQLQSSQLLAYKPKLPSLVGVEPTPELSRYEATVGDDSMAGNLFALGLALLAQGESEVGNNESATEQVMAAQQFLDPSSPDHYLTAAAGQIARTCFALKVVPKADLLQLLRLVKIDSLIVGMIPGWSMGPASRYAALVNHLGGNSHDAIVELLQCADYCNETHQYLWEYVSLGDILAIDNLSTAMEDDQRVAIFDRQRRVQNRFT